MVCFGGGWAPSLASIILFGRNHSESGIGVAVGNGALLNEIDDTTRFEINTSKFDLTVTKGELSEELRIFIQEELNRAKKEYGIS